MKRWCAHFLLLVLAGSLVFSQDTPLPPISQQSGSKLFVLPIFTLNVAPISGASLSVSGTTGQSTYCYWAVANYTVGVAISPLGCVSNGAGTLSSQNYVSITPFYYPAGATVDILQNSSPTSQPVGACNCAVTTGLTSGGVNQTSNTLQSYTVPTFNPNAYVLTLSNEVVSSGSTHLILRQGWPYPGTEVADLSNGGGGGIGGSGTPGYLPLWTGNLAVGNSIVTQSGSTVSVAGSEIVTGTLNAQQFTGPGSLILSSPIPSSPVSPVSGLSSLALQNDGNWYDSNNGGTFNQQAVYPGQVIANEIPVGTGAGTQTGAVIPNCIASTCALGFNATTQSFTQQTISGIPVTAANQGLPLACNGTNCQPSPNSIKAEQFCSGGFNAATGSCSGGAYNTMCSAIKAAISSAQNALVGGMDIDARAFSGLQYWAASCSTTVLYGSTTVGGTQYGKLFLGNVSIALDGPSSGYFSDGASPTPSNVGTPAVILPTQFYGIIGQSKDSTLFFPCTSAAMSGAPLCTHGFPSRAFPIASISVSGTQITFTTSGLVPSGGLSGGQNIWPEGAAINGETFVVVGAPSPYSMAGQVKSATSTTVVGNVDSGTSTAGCTGGSSICGTLYLLTPIFGFGTATVNAPYLPVQYAGGSQSFGQHLINLGIYGESTSANIPYGLVDIQNVNAGEQSGVDNVFCVFNVTGCLDVHATDSGPYTNVRMMALSSAQSIPSTFFAMVTGTNRGIKNWSAVANPLGGLSSNTPNAAIYHSGQASASPNASISFEDGHDEYFTDAVRVSQDANSGAVTVKNIIGPPSGKPGTNLVHLMNSGFICGGCNFFSLNQQSSGSTNLILDDPNTVACTDLALAQYSTDINGKAISSCSGQTGASTQITGQKITTLASTTSSAGLNVPPGTAPTSPVNGDFWSTTAGFYGRVNGSTVGPFGSGGFNPTITSPQQTQTIVNNGTTWVNSYSGVNVDSQTSDYTFSCPTDRLGYVEETITAAKTFALPQAGSTTCTGSNMALVVTNPATSTALLTVCSGTGTGGSCTGGSSTFVNISGTPTSFQLVPGSSQFIYSDATTGTGNYHVVPIATPFGGVNLQTASYTATLLDKDKLIVMNCSAACVLTLPASPPSSKWNIWGMSIGSTLATISLNSLTYNGTSSVPAFVKYMPLMIRTDGSNYFGDAPLVAGANVTLSPASNGVTVSATAGVPGWLSYYGDGSDGALSYSSNTTLTGVIYYATTFTCTGTTTLQTTSNNFPLIIKATTSITIGAGCTIQNTGTSTNIGDMGSTGGGGGGGTAAGSAGKTTDLFTNGTAAVFITGGTAGAAGGGTGGAGSTPINTAKQRTLIENPGITPYLLVGGTPGGTGGSSGGAGGNGGGVIVLDAPVITLGNGTVFNVSGANGTAASANNTGGGGGGGGGVVIIRSPGLTDNGAVFTVTAGSGGGCSSFTGCGSGGSGGTGWSKELTQ